jgi:hypothetical protein
LRAPGAGTIARIDAMEEDESPSSIALARAGVLTLR